MKKILTTLACVSAILASSIQCLAVEQNTWDCTLCDNEFYFGSGDVYTYYTFEEEQYYWDRTTHTTQYIESGMPTNLLTAVNSAYSGWNDAAAELFDDDSIDIFNGYLYTTSVLSSSNLYFNTCAVFDNPDTRACTYMCDSDYDNYVWDSDGTVLSNWDKVKITIAATYYNSSSTSAADLKKTILHEVGHAYGLAHYGDVNSPHLNSNTALMNEYSATSIMFANTKWNYSGRCDTPQACDVAGLYHLQYHEN
ncbi:MAG: hypothetical protein IJE51_06390 [Clostridia bacterium]|nr:hypothetical protein [Clostridia bacterium]